MTDPAACPDPPHARGGFTRRIILVAGPSGSGKSLLTERSGLPVVPLDEFYHEKDHPGLPRRFGIVDWDHPSSWDAEQALVALTALAHDGRATIPEYSISASRRTGSRTMLVGPAPMLIAEGIFAAELIAPLSRAGLLADAIVLDRPVLLVFALRLVRDLREARKPMWTLLRRGAYLARQQRTDVRRWTRAGMRPRGLASGVRQVRRIAVIAEAERHQHGPRLAERTRLRITAVCFLRDGPDGPELLGVRKHGTGSFMQVGGKLEPGETPLQAACREVEEEIGVRLRPDQLDELGTWTMPAANEPGTLVDATVLVADHPLREDFAVRAELAEHRWFPLAEEDPHVRIAPLMQQRIMPALRRRLG